MKKGCFFLIAALLALFGVSSLVMATETPTSQGFSPTATIEATITGYPVFTMYTPTPGPAYNPIRQSQGSPKVRRGGAVEKEWSNDWRDKHYVSQPSGGNE